MKALRTLKISLKSENPVYRKQYFEYILEIISSFIPFITIRIYFLSAGTKLNILPMSYLTEDATFLVMTYPPVGVTYLDLPDELSDGQELLQTLFAGHWEDEDEGVAFWDV